MTNNNGTQMTLIFMIIADVFVGKFIRDHPPNLHYPCFMTNNNGTQMTLIFMIIADLLVGFIRVIRPTSVIRVLSQRKWNADDADFYDCR